MKKQPSINPLLSVPKMKWETQRLNNLTFIDYLSRLEEIAINMFEWKNLPDTVDERFLELTLCELGYAVYFNDEELGNLALTCNIGGPLNVYRIPTIRRAYANNGYYRELTEKDSVLIYNNYLHTPTMNTVTLYARRLYELERTIEVNVNAQKTPLIIACEEQQLLTFKNILKKREDNELAIIGMKNIDYDNTLKTLDTTAPFVADRLQTLKENIWSEALTFFGVANTPSKRERVQTNEVNATLGGVQAQRLVMLNARRQAADQINKMFGTEIEVDFRQDYSLLDPDLIGLDTEIDTEYNEDEVEENG